MSGTEQNSTSGRTFLHRSGGFLLFFLLAVLLHGIPVSFLFRLPRHGNSTAESNERFTSFVWEDNAEVAAELSFELYYDDPTMLFYPRNGMGFDHASPLENREEIPRLRGFVRGPGKKAFQVDAEPLLFDRFPASFAAYFPP